MSAVFTVEQDYVLHSWRMTIIASGLDENSLKYFKIYLSFIDDLTASMHTWFCILFRLNIWWDRKTAVLGLAWCYEHSANEERLSRARHAGDCSTTNREITSLRSLWNSLSRYLLVRIYNFSWRFCHVLAKRYYYVLSDVITEKQRRWQICEGEDDILC